MSYDFIGTKFHKLGCFCPLPVVSQTRVFHIWEWCQKIRVSLGKRSRQPAAKATVPAQRPAGDHLRYDDLLQEYNQLRERSLRTTNALASAAHDLKTPLAILNGYIELLQNEKLGPLNDRQREILGDMHTSGQRLQQFIQDFLSYSVLETGEMKMRYETGNMNPCLSEVCRLWSHRFQERGSGALLPGQRETAGTGV